MVAKTVIVVGSPSFAYLAHRVVQFDQAQHGHLPCRRGEAPHDFKPYVTGFQVCKVCTAVERLPDFEPDWEIG